jgi:hypothetical protein
MSKPPDEIAHVRSVGLRLLFLKLRRMAGTLTAEQEAELIEVARVFHVRANGGRRMLNGWYRVPCPCRPGMEFAVYIRGSEPLRFVPAGWARCAIDGCETCEMARRTRIIFTTPGLCP